MKFGLIHLFLGIVLLSGSPAAAFTEGGCGAGDCRDCHAMSKQEAQVLLKGMVENILEVKLSEVPGLWAVDVENKGQKYPVFIDFSKQYLIAGKILKFATREDITMQSYINLNRVDVSKIPLGDALLIGNPKAAKKVVVFDDPECTFCKKLHPEMKKVAAEHNDIAFLIKMFPLKNLHPQAYDKAKAIICANSLALLDDSLAGKEIPAPTCATDQVDVNIALAAELGIKSTPTMVFPDGRVFPGFRDAEAIVKLLTEQPAE